MYSLSGMGNPWYATDEGGDRQHSGQLGQKVEQGKEIGVAFKEGTGLVCGMHAKKVLLQRQSVRNEVCVCMTRIFQVTCSMF